MPSSQGGIIVVLVLVIAKGRLTGVRSNATRLQVLVGTVNVCCCTVDGPW